MSKYFSNKYKNLVPYVPGEQPKDNDYIKLNTNESPFPPSEKAVALAGEAAKKLHLYSDPTASVLTEKVADMVGVQKNQVLMTNGSDEILNFAFMSFCDENTPAVFPDISYGFYKVFAQINNLPYEEIPLKDDFTINVDDYVGINKTIFIANPNAPTGIALTLDEIEKIVSTNPDNVVVIDEAYVDFGGESAVSLVDKYSNLLVTQTFSKSRSMAGMRIGFAVGNPELIKYLNDVKYSFNSYTMNRTSICCGVEAVKDDEYFKETTTKIIETREWAKEELTKLGFTFPDSMANFIFATHKEVPAKEIFAALREANIYVRYFNSPRIDNYLRITIGTKDEMKKLFEFLRAYLEK